MMSVADIPWNHFNPYNHFPDRQNFPSHPYQSTPPFVFLSHGLSQLSNPYHNNYSPLNMAALSPEELERFQKLSNEFEPDVQVGCPSMLNHGPTDIVRVLSYL